MRKHYLPLLALVLFTFGCGRAEKASVTEFYSGAAGARAPAPMPQMAVEMEMAQMDMDAFNSTAASGPDMPSSDDVERKLVKQAHIRIRAENLDAADASVNALMEKHGAYTASTEVEENSRYYSIRVPSSEYDAFLAGTNGVGRMLRRSETTEDVTLRYYDLEGRLNTKRELLKT
jgi:hypothetical protein